MGMTTDKALEILGMSEQARWRSGYEPTDEKEAIETIREALEQSESLKREGKWQEHDNYFACPFCACLAPSTDTADAIIWKLSNYCPDCRAKLGDGTHVIKKHAFEAGNLRYKKAIEDIKAEINSPNRNTCDYFIVDQIEKIVEGVSE